MHPVRNCISWTGCLFPFPLGESTGTRGRRLDRDLCDMKRERERHFVASQRENRGVSISRGSIEFPYISTHIYRMCASFIHILAGLNFNYNFSSNLQSILLSENVEIDCLWVINWVRDLWILTGIYYVDRKLLYSFIFSILLLKSLKKYFFFKNFQSII